MNVEKTYFPKNKQLLLQKISLDEQDLSLSSSNENRTISDIHFNEITEISFFKGKENILTLPASFTSKQRISNIIGSLGVKLEKIEANDRISVSIKSNSIVYFDEYVLDLGEEENNSLNLPLTLTDSDLQDLPGEIEELYTVKREIIDNDVLTMSNIIPSLNENEFSEFDIEELSRNANNVDSIFNKIVKVSNNEFINRLIEELEKTENYGVWYVVTKDHFNNNEFKLLSKKYEGETFEQEYYKSFNSRRSSKRQAPLYRASMVINLESLVSENVGSDKLKYLTFKSEEELNERVISLKNFLLS